jgi:hypothetical protein
MAVTLPLLLLILDRWVLGRIGSTADLKRALREKVPFFLGTALSAIVTFQAQHAGGAVKFDLAPLSTRLLVAAHSVTWYLAQMAFPSGLSPFHPFPGPRTVLSPGFVGAALFALALMALLLLRARRAPLVLAAWLAFVVGLLPVLGLVQVGMQSMAERYTYLPSIGPFVVFSAAVVRAARRVATVLPGKASPGTLAAVFGAALALPLGAATIRQIDVWRDSITLWTAAIERESVPVSLAFYNRGLAYAAAGHSDRAAADYDRAIALDPGYYKARNNRGVLFADAGDFARAVEQYTRAIEIDAGAAVAFTNRCLAYGRRGLYAQALADLERALALDPGDAKAVLGRGNVLLLTGRQAEALADFEAACRLGEEKGCVARREEGARP